MSHHEMQRVKVIDSHTGGEPTRIVVEGGPDLGTGPLETRLRGFREHQDSFRSAVVNEPRGSDVLVGGLLVPPVDRSCAAGVLFFNNVGYLGMCGHGTIGLVATLAYLGRISPGAHRIETPVGTVTATLHEDNSVSVRNVPSYRHASHISVHVPQDGIVTGDIAWGGNWFFLVRSGAAVYENSLLLSNVESLTDFTWRIRQALAREGITGAHGAEIDHIELFGAPSHPSSQSRNFVLCPGKAYDRSPCGTGTSAKMACLYADGKLLPGEIWRQESITGSVFEGSIEIVEDALLPTVRGSAYINAESTLLLDPADPLCFGIR